MSIIYASPHSALEGGRPYSKSMDKTEYGAYAVENVQPIIDETALIMDPNTPLYGSANVDPNDNRYFSTTGTEATDEDSLSYIRRTQITRAVSLPEQLDNYFLKDDDYDEDDDADIPQKEPFQDLETLTFQWQFRHTISYWISIGAIFGCLCFSVGSVFFVLENELEAKDVYTLVTYLYFCGSFAFLIQSYLSYYQILSERSSKDYNHLMQYTWLYKYLLLWGKKTVHYWTIFWLLLGTIVYHVAVTFEVLKYDFEPHSTYWYLFKFIPLWLGGFLFFVSGYLQMRINKFWLWRPYKLSWIAAYLNGLGGFFFFIGGFGVYFYPAPQHYWLAFYLLKVPYLVGSLLYLMGSVIYLYMWKLQQFGMSYLPHLNKESKAYKKPEKHLILNRDIIFIILYNFSALLGILGVAYSVQCHKFENWIKDFVEKVYASFGILSIASFLHREPEKPPFNYLIW
eukprot:CAMPEP_0197022924 /NCGR_PEP_ID=MMETSP1384-20130603/3722_1 /TAXON_ID=29189 /ORGANISM="Ammonia sp." /LENGTH=454 /DNA_ID=CAMNT_0042451051 /DNA_START=16 /DNA_END=1377 /DNA_ORIENTATION=+